MASHDGRRPARYHGGKSIPVPTWTPYIPIQKWNSPQGGQVHYTGAAAGASGDCGQSPAI